MAMSTTKSVPMPQTTVKEQIRSFILENLAQPNGISSFTDSEPLMEIGVIDSLGIFRLVSFLEDELGVRVDDQEINIETLKSVDTIEELVIRKRAKK
jgi:acyl carrier protein